MCAAALCLIRHEFGGEMCVHYTSEPGSECKNEQLPWWRDCGFVRLSSRMLEYVKRFFFDDSVAKANQRDTSAGFFGTVLALHLCGKVDIYGFTQRSGHYFEKLDRSKARNRSMAACFGPDHSSCASFLGSAVGDGLCLRMANVARRRCVRAGEGCLRGEARVGAGEGVLNRVPGAAGRRKVDELNGRRESGGKSSLRWRSVRCIMTFKWT